MKFFKNFLKFVPTFQNVLPTSETSVGPHKDTRTRSSTHTHTLTVELSGDSDFPLLGVDLGVDGDSTVVSQPKGLDHPLLQRLRHILLRHVEDSQVWKTNIKKTHVRLGPDRAAGFLLYGVQQT